MHNFVFHNPTKILFGQDTLQQIGPETAALGQRCLLVYGCHSAKRSGNYDQVHQTLQAAGMKVVDHGGVQSNPLLSHVRQGIELAKKEEIDVLVALGGGSVIDTAKAIAVGSLVAHDVWKFFTGKKGIKASLPVVTVLTLAGSGSEMNSGMVLTNDTTMEKFGIGHRLLHPRVSILDPSTTISVPPEYTSYGAIDAISHVLEFYLTTTDPETPVQDRLMEGLIENAIQACNRCRLNPADYQARAHLMWTATLALNGLTAAGLGRVGFPMHLIEHSLSALYNVPHGAGLAVVMLGWLRFHLIPAAHRIATLGRRVFSDRITRESADIEAAQATITCLASWFRQIGAPLWLEDLGIEANAIATLAENSKGQAKLWRLKEYTPQRVKAILECCFQEPPSATLSPKPRNP